MRAIMPSPSSQTTRADIRRLDQEALVRLAQQDNTAALEELVRRQQKRVYAVLAQMAPERNDIADLTQEVLIRMCRSVKNLRVPATFNVWLNRIITNLFYDELRKKPRQLNTQSLDAPTYSGDPDSQDLIDTVEMVDPQLLPESKSLGNELQQKVYAAMATLPEHFRVPVVLREVQGLSYEEIASVTGTELGTVKSRIARGRLKLQQLLRDYLE